jgi:hypothetical protein
VADGLSTAEIVQHLLNTKNNEVLAHVPTGTKNNVFCIVNNERNAERQIRGLPSLHDDDCGAWISSAGHTTKIPYITEEVGTLKRIYFIKKLEKVSLSKLILHFKMCWAYFKHHFL